MWPANGSILFVFNDIRKDHGTESRRPATFGGQPGQQSAGIRDVPGLHHFRDNHDPDRFAVYHSFPADHSLDRRSGCSDTIAAIPIIILVALALQRPLQGVIQKSFRVGPRSTLH